MYQAAEGKVHPERKKIKTAVDTIFELLHRVEASPERVGSISSLIDSNILAQQPEVPKDCTDAWRKELRPWCLKCQRDCKQAAKVGVVFYPQYLKLKGSN